MDERLSIPDTAFVTSLFRASHASLSMDRFAHLWGSPRSASLVTQYVSAVSHFEPLAHCLRNRFFYEAVAAGFRNNEIEVLINFGCGFSMYPFLLDKGLAHIEIDMPHIIDFKKEQLGQWQANGIVPPRDITFIAADFISGDLDLLLARLLEELNGRRSFVLIEGVLFFLSKKDTAMLFQLFHDIQGPGSLLGSVSFTPELVPSEVFQKLITFAERNLDKNESFEYQTLENSFYEQLGGYRLTDHQDSFSLAGLYAPGIAIEKEEVLNEHMYILKKK